MEPESTVAELLDAIAATTGGNPQAETTIDVLRAMSARVASAALPDYYEWSWGPDDEATGEPDRTMIVLDIPAHAGERRDALPIAGQISLEIHIERHGQKLRHGFFLETPAADYEEGGQLDLGRGETIAEVEHTAIETLLDLLAGRLRVLVVSRRRRRLFVGPPELQYSERWMRLADDGSLHGALSPAEIELVETGRMPFAIIVEFADDPEEGVTYTVSDVDGVRLRAEL